MLASLARVPKVTPSPSKEILDPPMKRVYILTVTGVEPKCVVLRVRLVQCLAPVDIYIDT